jgi:hypothetical protein
MQLTSIFSVVFISSIGNTNSLEKINEVQRKGLALCLDLPTQSSLEALEVVSNPLSVDLRREEIEIRQLGKINSYKSISNLPYIASIVED